MLRSHTPSPIGRGPGLRTPCQLLKARNSFPTTAPTARSSVTFHDAPREGGIGNDVGQRVPDVLDSVRQAPPSLATGDRSCYACAGLSGA